jgi:hypothetical protein
MPRSVSSRVTTPTVPRHPITSATSSSGLLRWLILASLGVVAQNACGGRAMPGNGDLGLDEGGAGGDGGSAGEGGSSGGTRATTPVGGTGGSAMSTGGAAGAGPWGASGSAGAGVSGAAGAAGAGGGVAEDGYYTPCVDPVDLVGGVQVCANGMAHRLYAGGCPNELPRPQALDPVMVNAFEQLSAAQGLTSEESAAMFVCREDTDCNERDGGFCTFTTTPSEWFGQLYTTCEYACTSDADCGGGTLCDCGSPGGRCVSATCFTDDDCGPGWRCSRYTPGASCGAAGTAYACQSPEDACVADAECAGGSFCQYNGIQRRCESANECPVPGRPFLVGDAARSAGAAERADWYAAALRSLAAPVPAALEPALAAELCRQWSQLGLMEHASVASFARFALELLAAGAPPELLDETSRAMQDEIRHAQLCFALARRYGKSEVGPGCLDVDDAIPPFDFEQIVLRAVREGCIGETVSAFEAAEAAEGCRDPVARTALEGIARDEARHAALAWRFVAWALPRAPRALAERVHEIFVAERALAGNASPVAVALDAREAALRAFGIVCDGERTALRARAFVEIITPSAAKLCGPTRPRAKPRASENAWSTATARAKT